MIAGGRSTHEGRGSIKSGLGAEGDRKKAHPRGRRCPTLSGPLSDDMTMDEGCAGADNFNGTIRRVVMGASKVKQNFELEKDLVATLCRATPELFASDLGRHPLRVFTEVPVYSAGVCIPDMVLVYQISPSTLPVKVLSSFEAGVLSYIAANGGESIEAVASGMYCQVKNVETVVKSLVRKGLVSGTSDALIADVPALTGQTHVVAIEAKLTRWKDAIEQAEEYFVFAHRSFIAMPADVAGRPEVLERCASVGVGVFAVDPEGAVRSLLISRENTPVSAQYLRLVSTTTAPESQRGARRASFVDGQLPSAH